MNNLNKFLAEQTPVDIMLVGTDFFVENVELTDVSSVSISYKNSDYEGYIPYSKILLIEAHHNTSSEHVSPFEDKDTTTTGGGWNEI